MNAGVGKLKIEDTELMIQGSAGYALDLFTGRDPEEYDNLNVEFENG